MLKSIINDFKEFYSWLKEFLEVKRYAIKFELARRMADMMQRAMNRQISVIINGNHKFEYWTSDTLKKKKKAGMIPKSWGMYELLKVTFYKTPETANNKLNTEEREKYKRKFISYARRYMR